MPVASELAS